MSMSYREKISYFMKHHNRFTRALFSLLSCLSYQMAQVFKSARRYLNTKMKKSELQASKTVCALPWIHYFTSEMAHNFPCCISTDTSLPNVSASGRKYNVYESGVFEQAWNSDYMKELRLDMLAGIRPKPCERCYKFEDLGIPSHRYWANKKWSTHFDRVLPSMKPDGSLPLKLYSADIRLGNLCNLRCRMCSPVSSKGLTAEWRLMNLIDDKEADEFMSLDWFERPEFWDMFLRYADDLESLHFAGGEPFIIKQHYVFLKSLIEKGIAKKLTLSYNTNLTMLPAELLELWKQFKVVNLMISLDGTEEVNHYIRFPSNWANIHKNIKFLHDNLEAYNIHNLDFNITVQVYNIFNLPQLVDFLIDQYPKATFPMLSLLFGPEELSIQILPTEKKQLLTKLWTEFLSARKSHWMQKGKWHEEVDNLVNNIEGIIEFMNKSDQGRLLPKFKMRTRVYDKSRNQSCPEVIPELASLFS